MLEIKLSYLILSIIINKCLLNSDHEKLIYIAYHHLLTSNVKCEWLTHIKKILCTNGFPYVWENQGVVNEKQFLCLFEQRSKDIFIQECLSPRCRMYKEIKPTFGDEIYLEMNINTRLRSCLTKLRLSSHKYLVELSLRCHIWTESVHYATFQTFKMSTM